MSEHYSKEDQEHEELLGHIRTVLSTRSGVAFAKYLLKSFDFGEQPHIMCRGEDLLDRVSFLRAGNSIYKILMQANADLTGQIVSTIEKEKIYASKTEQA